MDIKLQMRLTVLLAVVFGAIGGAVISPFAWKWFGAPVSTVVREITGAPAAIPAGDEEAAVIAVVEKVNPAVVNIGIFKSQRLAIETEELPFEDFFGEGFPFEFRFPRPAPAPSGGKTELRQVGGGSGFVVGSGGLIVTNKHVVADEEAVYRVKLANGQEYEAKILAKDPVLDVALMKIDGKDLPTLPLGDSDSIRLGQSVIAIGNALAEFGNTVTRGVISGVGRRVEAGDGMGMSEVIDEAIQTDAAINPGNSGGPLLNLSGEAIGINTAVSRSGQTIGFAIPVNAVKRTIESVQKTGRIVRPWLGVRYTPITPALAEANALPVTHGALIIRGEQGQLAVQPGSPADKAGLVENDIILEIGGRKLQERESLSREIAKYNVGDAVKLKIFHKGKEKTVKLTLEEFPTI